MENAVKTHYISGLFVRRIRSWLKVDFTVERVLSMMASLFFKITMVFNFNICRQDFFSSSLLEFTSNLVFISKRLPVSLTNYPLGDM